MGCTKGADTFVKQPFLRGNAGRVPTFELYPGIRLITEEKSRKETSVRVAEKCQLGTIRFVDRVAASTDCNHYHPWLAHQVDQVDPRSAQISSELAKEGVPRIS
jgi:hypothetical protein